MRKITALFFAFILFYLLNIKATAQEYPRRETDLNQLQSLLPIQKYDQNLAELSNNLLQFYQRPIDLNACTKDELAATYILSEYQLNGFFAYRTLVQRFESVYELQAIPEFDLSTIYKIIPFVYVKPQGLSLRSIGQALDDPQQHYLVVRCEQTLEQQKGFTPPDNHSKVRYLGSPQEWFIRYKNYTAKDVSIGLTLKKDAGEVWGWQPNRNLYLADFMSFHLSVQNKGHWKNITLGDYQLQLGQGLVASSGFYIGKGGETVMATRRNQLGIRPYTSTIEYNYFRGIAATYQLNSFSITGFYSRTNRDANVKLEDDVPIVSSLQTAGLHRTASEIADAGSLKTQDLGLHTLYQSPSQHFQIGFTLLQTSYQAAIQKDTSKIYNRYEFGGKQNLVAGSHYAYLWHNFNFFGEIARSSSGGMGVVNGLLTSISKRIDYTLLWRHYDRNFHSFYGNAFAEGSYNKNEIGIYTGLKYVYNRQWQAGVYVDFYRFPEQRYLVSKPSDGFDVMLRGMHSPSKKTIFILQYHHEQKAKDIPNRLTKLDLTVTTIRHNFMASLEHQPSLSFGYQSRFYWSRFCYSNFSTSVGWALVQDVSFKKQKYSIIGRLAYFNTDDYDSRIYTYENDVQYAFSIPAYFDRGLRGYIVFHYKLTRSLDGWFRFSRTNLFNQPDIGSDLSLINAPHRSDVKVQFRYSF
jgi:Helix-hairpin-helix motif